MQVNNIKIFDDFDYEFENESIKKSDIFESNLSKLAFMEFMTEINKLANSINDLNELFISLLENIKRIFSFSKYNVVVFSQNVKLYSNDNFDYELNSFLINSGILKLIMSEKKPVLIPEPEKYSVTNNVYLLIIPFFSSAGYFGLVCFNTNFSKAEISKEIVLLIELATKIIGNKALAIIIDQNLKVENEKNEFMMKNLYDFKKYVAIGELCTSSFHDLKNRTQILLSSVDLVKKLDLRKEPEKICTVVNIMANEIPKFSKTIRMISDVSKNLLSDKSIVYTNIYDIITELKETLETTQITKKLHINISKKYDGIKIFGSPNSIFEALFLLLNEINKAVTNQIGVEFSISEYSKRVSINLSIKIDEISREEIFNFVDENHNLNFVMIKRIIKTLNGTIVTDFNENGLTIILDLPKRSGMKRRINEA